MPDRLFIMNRGRLLHSFGCFFRLFLLAIVLASCAAALPRPPAAQVSAADYLAVPFSPRIPPVEFVPPSPAKNAVWVDGTWQWTGDRYVWRFGSWVVPPPGARRARWVIVRRPEDGQLFFSPSSWKDASGKTLDDREWAYALGPRARARSRLGATQPTASDMETVTAPPPDEGLDEE